MQTYTGKTIEELLETAAKEKGVSTEELTYEIIDQQSGFLGFGSKVEATVYCKKDIIAFIKKYLDSYFKNIELEVSVTVNEENSKYMVELDASNNAILIGKNGRTLTSLNTVVRAAVSAVFKKRIHVLIDINGYKEEKYHKVCMLAVKVGKQVQKTKIEAILDPMPADERKAIHNYLTTMKYVRTESIGEGSRRQLKIVYDETKK